MPHPCWYLRYRTGFRGVLQMDHHQSSSNHHHSSEDQSAKREYYPEHVSSKLVFCSCNVAKLMASVGHIGGPCGTGSWAFPTAFAWWWSVDYLQLTPMVSATLTLASASPWPRRKYPMGPFFLSTCSWSWSQWTQYESKGACDPQYTWHTSWSATPCSFSSCPIYHGPLGPYPRRRWNCHRLHFRKFHLWYLQTHLLTHLPSQQPLRPHHLKNRLYRDQTLDSLHCQIDGDKGANPSDPCPLWPVAMNRLASLQLIYLQQYEMTISYCTLYPLRHQLLSLHHLHRFPRQSRAFPGRHAWISSAPEVHHLLLLLNYFQASYPLQLSLLGLNNIDLPVSAAQVPVQTETTFGNIHIGFATFCFASVLVGQNVTQMDRWHGMDGLVGFEMWSPAKLCLPHLVQAKSKQARVNCG